MLAEIVQLLSKKYKITHLFSMLIAFSTGFNNGFFEGGKIV
jgi:hypothetical protein